MAPSERMNYRFDFGSAVAVVAMAPAQFRRLEAGSVCGMRVVDNEEAAQGLGVSVGTRVYLVENGAGEAGEVPEAYLEALPDDAE